MTTRIQLALPDDMHLHLRDGAMMQAVAPFSAAHFGRAIIMPHLVPPVVTTQDAIAYRQRIVEAAGPGFTPLMTLYLTEQTDPDDVEHAFTSGVAKAVKLYPAGATTNSASGVRDIANVLPVLERMAKIGMPLCTHGEVTASHIDIFDREAAFISDVLDPLRQRLPQLRVCMEHITTKDAADCVAADTSGNLVASITTHHLMLNRNHLLVGGIKPHYYCLPIIKRESHRQALVSAVTGGDSRFFLGTDSAPHPTHEKESACGCAGVFSAPNTLNCLALLFEREGALDKLEGFTSRHGAAWYGLEPSAQTITLEKRAEAVEVPGAIQVQNADQATTVTVFDPLEPLHWHVVRDA